MANLMSKVHLIVTDSGGLQRRRAYLWSTSPRGSWKKQERPEGIEAGTAKLLGTSYERVFGRHRTYYYQMKKSIKTWPMQ